MNESMQEIVTDLVKRQSFQARFLPTETAVRPSESNIGVAVWTFVWRVIGQVDDGELDSRG
jgi:hypothetical protein